ncbi:hypothetical protein NW755_013781 [Fusarium falciforme]|uniref:NmrA-like domain-containing protein n=1 Tax=Fusarium falciforme TaxID=195108 RepID=A0A9W8QVB8_9HYPO|nr:hypothetical protein NW755_013781 [Fusarium falciforme]
MAPSFLITAATGRQGGSAARVLLARGATVHALVRNRNSLAALELERLGSVLFEGDFDNVPAIQAAAAGVTGIFLNLWPTPNPEDQLSQAKSFIDAAKQANSLTIVVSTAFLTGRPELWTGVDGLEPYYTGKAMVEDVVRQAGLPSYSILRPSFLMHNYLIPDSQYHFLELAPKGILAHAYKAGRRMPHLDAADVGKFAAEALLNPGAFNGHEIELGFQNLTPEEAAETIYQVSGRTVRVHGRTDQEITSQRHLLPTLPFQVLANEQDLTIDGEYLQNKYGVTLTTFEDFLSSEAVQLLKSLPEA